MIARAFVVLALAVAGCSPSAGAPATPTQPPTVAPSLGPSPSATPQPTVTLPDGVEMHPADAAVGVPLGYISYVPPGAPDGPKPLLVFLHGSAESGRGTELSLRLLFKTAITGLIWDHRWPADRPFIVLAPQHNDAATPCFTADEIEAFIYRAFDEYPVDRTRVYITGLSCGAIGAWNYLGEHTNEQVAAAVLIAGDGRHAFDRAGCSLAVVPVWAFHGDLDKNVDPAGSIDTIAALKKCTKPKAVDARINVFQNLGHQIWENIYNLNAGFDIYAWMLGYTKP